MHWTQNMPTMEVPSSHSLHEDLATGLRGGQLAIPAQRQPLHDTAQPATRAMHIPGSLQPMSKHGGSRSVRPFLPNAGVL